MTNPVLPFQEQILLAMQVAEKTIDGVLYLIEEFDAIVDKVKLKPNDPAIPILAKTKADFQNEFLRLVTLKYDKLDKPWDGTAVRISDYQNMQKGLALSAADNLRALGIPEGVQLDIGIKNSAQLLRAYSVNGKELDAKMVKHLDDISNSLFSKHGKVSEGGTIYNADIHGKILKDEHGKIKADPQEMRELIRDETNGIAKFHEELGLPPPIVKQHILPEEAEPSRPVPVREKPIEPARAPETPVPAEAPSVQRPGSAGG